MTYQDITFIKTISVYNWLDVNKTAKKRVMDIFTSRGLTREYVAMAYGEIDLLTALKMIK